MKKWLKITLIVIGSIIVFIILMFLLIYASDPQHMTLGCLFPPNVCYLASTNITCDFNPDCDNEFGVGECNFDISKCEYFFFNPHTISKRECLDMGGEFIKLGCV